MDFDISQAASMAGQFLLVAAIAFGIFVAIVSHLRFQELFKESAVLERSGPAGLLDAQIADRLGTLHGDSLAFSILLVKAQQWEQVEAAGAGTQLATFIRERVTAVLRRTDALLDFGPDRWAIVVDVPLASVPAVIARITEGLRRDVFRYGEGQAFRVAVSMGVAASPEDGRTVKVLRECAESALVTALAESATVRYSSSPPMPAKHTHTQEDLPDDHRNLIDPLTGVLRQEHFDPALQKYVARYRSEDFPVSVICLDVDYLRRYNDQYGQKTGDMILRQISEYLQGALREADLIARCDGDEFIVLLAATPQEALGVAHRLATAIKRMPFQTSGAPLKVAVSGGVAGYPDHGGGGRPLYAAASAALKQAKARGRSMVVMYNFSMQTESKADERVDVF